MSDNSIKEIAGPAAPSVSAGQIPDLLKIGAIQSNVQMDVDTDVLDPVVNNATFVRFVLQNKGILHSHSKIQFAFAQTGGEAWVPLNIGIAALVQRATLRVGNQTICEIDDFANFTAYRSQFMSGEAMRERLQYTTGQCMGKKICYNNEGDIWSDANPPVDISNAFGGGGSLDFARGVGVNNGRNDWVQPSQYAAVPTNQNTQMPAYMSLYNTDPDVSNRANNTFQWSLSDFFPFLKTNQLPLYMMKEQVSLEFVLNAEIAGGAGSETGGRAWVASGGGAGTAYALDSTETKMFADYQYYPQEMMVAYANANRNMQFSYVDYRLSKLTVATNTSGQNIRNVGGAGRIISKVCYGFQNTTPTDATSPLIKWNATAMNRSAGLTTVDGVPLAPSGSGGADTRAYNNSELKSNLKINGGFIYPIDVDNNARHHHNVVQAEGLTPYSTRQEYSNEGNSITTRQIEGHLQKTMFAGTAFWQATRLNKGERVNSRGIELYYNVDLPDGASSPVVGNPYTLRCWLETIKFATLKDGFVEAFLA